MLESFTGHTINAKEINPNEVCSGSSRGNGTFCVKPKANSLHNEKEQGILVVLFLWENILTLDLAHPYLWI